MVESKKRDLGMAALHIIVVPCLPGWSNLDGEGIQQLHGGNIYVLEPNEACRTIKQTECSKYTLQRTLDFSMWRSGFTSA